MDNIDNYVRYMDGRIENAEKTAISPLPSVNAPFFRQNITENHWLVFYATRTNALNIGYRELTPNDVSAFQTIYSTGFSLRDCAFLATQTAVHSALIVKTLFGSRVIYRKRGEYGFMEPITLYEGQNAGNCVIFILKGIIHVFFIQNGNPYFCQSTDSGNVFDKPRLYKRKFCKEPRKTLLNWDADKKRRLGLECAEMYVDSENADDVQILPDLTDALPEPEKREAAGVEEESYTDSYDPFVGMKF